jgi:uncharacterized protein YdeI (BOF family)
MKKIILSMLFLAVTSISFAQEDRKVDQQENDQDKIQQEPQLPAQVTVERSARLEAKRLHDEKVADKRAKRLARKETRVKARLSD